MRKDILNDVEELVICIPRYTVKTKMSLGSIHNQVYFCNIFLQKTLPSFAP